MKKPTEDVIATWAQLMRVSRTILENIEGELKEAGLPPLVWYDILHELAPAQKRGLRPFELVERMLLAQYNTSRLLARMEKEGLVERGMCPEDGRGQVVRITDAGRAMRKRIWEVYGPAIQKYFGNSLTSAQTRQLVEILRKLSKT